MVQEKKLINGSDEENKVDGFDVIEYSVNSHDGDDDYRRALRKRNNVLGGILIVLGIYFLADNFYLINIPLNKLWPLALIALGLYLLIRRS